jgi:hypothetical protein
MVREFLEGGAEIAAHPVKVSDADEPTDEQTQQEVLARERKAQEEHRPEEKPVSQFKLS